jgi:cytochrome c oxidase subunit 2
VRATLPLVAVLVAGAAAVWAGQGAASPGGERVIQVTARRFSYSPDVIELEVGVPVVIELTSLDREHGFTIPDLGLRVDVEPGKTARVRIVPDKVGTFPFHCDIFCGSGHEEMAGRIVVVAARQSRALDAPK